MTHLSEAAFVESLQERFERQFGADAIEREYWCDDTGCFADFWVDVGDLILAIEVENDEDSVRSGVAQALEYAANDPRAVPVVYVPAGHVERAQVQALRSVCPIVEVDVDDADG